MLTKIKLLKVKLYRRSYGGRRGGRWGGTNFATMRSLRLRANGRNNSQHCCANNVGSCCVRTGSGVQTDATTPNKFGTCSASWEEYNP